MDDLFDEQRNASVLARYHLCHCVIRFGRRRTESSWPHREGVVRCVLNRVTHVNMGRVSKYKKVKTVDPFFRGHRQAILKRYVVTSMSCWLQLDLCHAFTSVQRF